MFPLNSIFCSMESMAMLKSVADNGSPCLTSNFSVNSLFIFTIAFVPVNVSAINFLVLMVYCIDLGYYFVSVGWIESVYIVNKYIMEIYIIFMAFFKSLAYNGYIIKCWSIQSETHLNITQFGFSYVWQSVVQYNLHNMWTFTFTFVHHICQYAQAGKKHQE
jgi:hypothetical protein